MHTDGRDNEKLMTNAAMNKKERKHLVRDADNVSREDQMIVKMNLCIDSCSMW